MKMHKIEMIENKLNDYKICEDCFHLNWYENDYCVMCNNTKFNDSIKRVKEKVIKIKEDFDDLENYEIEV